MTFDDHERYASLLVAALLLGTGAFGGAFAVETTAVPDSDTAGSVTSAHVDLPVSPCANHVDRCLPPPHPPISPDGEDRPSGSSTPLAPVCAVFNCDSLGSTELPTEEDDAATDASVPVPNENGAIA